MAKKGDLGQGERLTGKKWKINRYKEQQLVFKNALFSK